MFPLTGLSGRGKTKRAVSYKGLLWSSPSCLSTRLADSLIRDGNAVWPSSPHSGTCWDVSSKSSLSHNGGGDSQAISNMILYAIDHYKVDPTKVFVTGGSSGGSCFSSPAFCFQNFDLELERKCYADVTGASALPSHDVQRHGGDISRVDICRISLQRRPCWVFRVLVRGCRSVAQQLQRPRVQRLS